MTKIVLALIASLTLQQVQANQPHLFGTITWGGSSNCIWSNGSSGYQNYSADTDCPDPSVTGALSAPTTKVPGFKAAYMPKGEYQIIATGVFTATATISCSWRFHNGTSAALGEIGFRSDQDTHSVMIGNLSSTANGTDVTVQIQNNNISGSSACTINNNSANENLMIWVYKMN